MSEQASTIGSDTFLILRTSDAAIHVREAGKFKDHRECTGILPGSPLSVGFAQQYPKFTTLAPLDLVIFSLSAL